MRQNSKYFIIPLIQGVGGFVLWFSQITLPESMAVCEAILFLLLAVNVVLIPRLIWILVSSYLINLSKYVFYRINGNEIVSFCMYPFFVYESKKQMANFFGLYDDRTCFSMNRYLNNAQGYETLRQYILLRNRILALIYSLCSLLTVLLLCAAGQYMLGWIVLFGAIEHFLYQSEYKKIGSANAMAFAGLKNVDDRLMLHMLVNQSKLEELSFGQEVAEILSEQMFMRDGDYFFKYLCLSSMFGEIYRDKENTLSQYIDVLVRNVMDGTPDALQSIVSMKKNWKYREIEDDVCIFYNSYREFLLYALMYYRLKQNRNAYVGLSNYIRHMLEKIEINYVQNNALSTCVLSEKFWEYKSLYQRVVNFEFVPETSIFTGYDTLPVWKQQRDYFINAYNNMAQNVYG